MANYVIGFTDRSVYKLMDVEEGFYSASNEYECRVFKFREITTDMWVSFPERNVLFVVPLELYTSEKFKQI